MGEPPKEARGRTGGDDGPPPRGGAQVDDARPGHQDLELLIDLHGCTRAFFQIDI